MKEWCWKDARLPGVNTWWRECVWLFKQDLISPARSIIQGWFANAREATAKRLPLHRVILSISRPCAEIWAWLHQAVKWNSMIFNQMLKREFVEQAGQGICNFVWQGQFRITAFSGFWQDYVSRPFIYISEDGKYKRTKENENQKGTLMFPGFLKMANTNAPTKMKTKRDLDAPWHPDNVVVNQKKLVLGLKTKIVKRRGKLASCWVPNQLKVQ